MFLLLLTSSASFCLQHSPNHVSRLFWALYIDITTLLIQLIQSPAPQGSVTPPLAVWQNHAIYGKILFTYHPQNDDQLDETCDDNAPSSDDDLSSLDIEGPEEDEDGRGRGRGRPPKGPPPFLKEARQEACSDVS